jgi:hypothetical protein
MLNQLIENTLKNIRLRKVRVKSDPSIPPVFGYENVTHFEGYILEECGNKLSVYIINAPPNVDPLQTVSIARIEEIPQPVTLNKPHSYEELKTMLLKALLKAGFNEGTPVFNQIKNTNNPEFVKTFLDQAGIKPEELAIFAEASDLTSSTTPDKDQISLDYTFGKPESKNKKFLKSLEKGLSIFDKALSTTSELLFDRDKNIIGRLTRFLKTFDVNDLINLKNLKLKSKDYPVLPYQDVPVYIYGLPTLKYVKTEEQKYQIKGKVTGINYTSDGVKYIITNLEPPIKDLASAMLDFSIINNSTKTGKVIFNFKDGKKRFSLARIFLGPNGWEARVLRYGIPDESSESKKGIAFILLANNLLSAALGPDEIKQALKQPIYNDIVMSFASDLSKYDKNKLSDIETAFTNLKHDEEFVKKPLADKLNNLKSLIQFIKENI